MIKAGMERIAIQGRVWIEGYFKLKIRGTDETELRPDDDFLHIYAKRDSSDVIKLYYRDDDNTETEIGGGGSGVSDHGALSGLTDDDHTQYQKESEKDSASGYAGLNSSSRITKGVDTTDDLIVDSATTGLVIKDTQGTPHYWRLSVDNSGSLITTDLGTTKP